MHKTGAPAIQEQPLQQAIADVREWNEQLRTKAAAKLNAEHARRMASLTSEQKAERDHRVMIFAAETKRSLQTQSHGQFSRSLMCVAHSSAIFGCIVVRCFGCCVCTCAPDGSEMGSQMLRPSVS